MSRDEIAAPGKIAFRAIVSIGILTALLYFLPVEKLLHAMSSVPISSWLVVILGFITGHIVSAYKWRLLLTATGVSITAPAAIKAHAAGLFANLCLPSIVGGDVIRAGMIVKEKGQLAEVSVGSLMDRLNDTVALVVIAGIAGLFIQAGDGLGSAFNAVAGLVLGLVFLGLIFIYKVSAHRLPKPLIPITKKIQTAFKAFLAMPQYLIGAFFMSVGIQCAFVGLNIHIAIAIGIDIDIVLWFWAWPFAKLIALTPISLGGIGVREVALAGLLTPFGVDTALSVAQSLSWEAILIVTGVVAGAMVFLLPKRSKVTA